MSLYVQRNEEVISADSRSLISKRYCTVTSAMNREFWNITSDRQNSIYVGSYGRETAIDTSDIDILMSLPESYYNQFNSVYGNGQSRLLQVVRQAILVRYPRSVNCTPCQGQFQRCESVPLDGYRFYYP